MASQAAARGNPRAFNPAHAPAVPKRRPLRVADPPAKERRSIGDVGTLLAFGLFVLCLGLAALHAVLVENQAELDELSEQNGLRRQRIDQLQAEIADLDSPEGLERHALAVGLVAATEIVTLIPVTPGHLAPPDSDAFALGAHGIDPAADDALFASRVESDNSGLDPPDDALGSQSTTGSEGSLNGVRIE